MKKYSALVALVALVVTSLSTAAVASLFHQEEKFVAVARAKGNVGNQRSERMEIVIERWSTDEERERLVRTLIEGGPQALVDELQVIQPVGRVRFGTRTSYPLSYSREFTDEDGNRIIRLATDRPIKAVEHWMSSGTERYAFSLVELRVDANNEGEGTMMLGATIKPDPESGTFILEGYDSAPVHLGSVRPGR